MSETGAAPTPASYGADDGYDDSRGIDMCPHCETALSANDGIVGPVYDKQGRAFETIYDTDPTERPFFCPDCFAELDRNEKRQTNATLNQYMTADTADTADISDRGDTDA